MMIWSIAVAPDFQGKGVGSSLLKQAENVAQATGAPKLRIHTNTRMTKNIILYKKAGFEEIDVKPHPNRVGHELVFMEKSITSF
jgi:ribosomal protein S18 acetylase RimI-like enzyme